MEEFVGLRWDKYQFAANEWILHNYSAQLDNFIV